MRTLRTVAVALAAAGLLPFSLPPTASIAASVPTIVAISAGDSYTCALTSAGAVECWGSNEYGQLGDGTTIDRHTPVGVSGLSRGVTAIEAGYLHTCALLATGALMCWGNNGSGQLGDGTTTTRLTPVRSSVLTGRATAVAVGNRHTCAVTGEGGVVCWGSNYEGELGDGSTKASLRPVAVAGLQGRVMRIAAGALFTCALTDAGGVGCWGDNGSGQLGDGTHEDRLAAVAVQGLSTGVAAVTAGDSHACVLTTAGGVKCWGQNAAGEIGDGQNEQRDSPVDVVGLASGVRSVSAGGHTCALLVSGAVKCWGWNGAGELGDGTTEYSLTPVDTIGLATPIAAIAVGQQTCALTAAGGVLCWGWNDHGQVGDGTTTNRLTPVSVTGLSGEAGHQSQPPATPAPLSAAPTITAISAGGSFTCALTKSGDVLCWGFGEAGRLGDGTTANRLTPVAVVGLPGKVVSVAAGAGQACAVTSEGSIFCWGANEHGQLGDGTTTNRLTAVPVRGLPGKVVAVTAGTWHSCALTAEGGVLCWGDNTYGELGDGTTTNRSTPAAVSGLGSGIKAIASGGFPGGVHTCAVTTTGGVKCWGLNESSQLGDGTTTDRSAPVDVTGLTSGVQAVAPGGGHTCALTGTGGVKCWGDGSVGQIGDGSMREAPAPTDVAGLTSGVIAIAAGMQDMAAVTTDGAVMMWGWIVPTSIYGPMTDAYGTPVGVTGLDQGVVAVAAGHAHLCALTAAGAVKCWGNNEDGQLGDGTTTYRESPVSVEFAPAAPAASAAPGATPPATATVDPAGPRGSSNLAWLAALAAAFATYRWRRARPGAHP